MEKQAQVYEVQTNEEVVTLYDDYNQGKISFTQYAEEILTRLDNYFKFIVSRNAKNYSVEFEDLMQESRLIVLKKLDSYNPHKGALTSYFTQYIEEAQRELVRKTHGSMTMHYGKKYAYLNRVAKEAGYSGVDDPELTPAKLSMMANVPITTVSNAIERENVALVSLDANSENFESTATNLKTPETSILEREQQEFLIKQLQKCSNLERFLISMLVINPEREDKPSRKHSVRYVLSLLKTNEYRQMFADELPKNISEVFLKQKLSAALERIKFNKATREYVGEELYEYQLVEQACADDIENAVLCGII